MIIRDIVYFAKVKPDAIIPTKREEDGAYDIYANFPDEYLLINPHTSQLVPTGIASAFNSEHCFIFRERGSTGIKNLKVNAGVIDSGFRSEWFVCLYNANEYPLVIAKDYKNTEQYIRWFGNWVVIYPYTKAIVQALFIPVPKIHINEISYDELKEIPSQRGMGQLGSSLK